MFAAADMVPTMWLPTATTVAMTGLVTIPRRIANYKTSKTTLETVKTFDVLLISLYLLS